jgi:hypothetical protein
MSVIVSALLPDVFAIKRAPQSELEITRDEAIQLVTAVQRKARTDARHLGVDDFQFGYYAIGVNPHGFLEAFLTLPNDLQANIRPHVDFALKQSLAISVETRDDRSHVDAKPVLRLEADRFDDPQVQWTGSHAVEALRNVGIKYDTDNPHALLAKDLAAACEKRLDKVSDMDTARLLEIAEYAISQAGPDAQVLAA